MIELTEREKLLISQIDFEPSTTSHDATSWRPIADAIEELTRSLLKRKAFPQVRWKIFSDPTFFIGGRGRSHRQVFEKSGARGDAIFRHRNFVKYLHYFVYGPDLPKQVIESFQQKVIECGQPFTSGDRSTVANFARRLTRSHGLKADKAEEFYKLALECRLDQSDALSVRDAVKTVR